MGVRRRWETYNGPAGGSCNSESQVRTCHNGEWSAYTGSYTVTKCYEPCTSPDKPNLGTENKMMCAAAGPGRAVWIVLFWF